MGAQGRPMDAGLDLAPSSDVRPNEGPDRLLVLLFGGALFLSSALLFSVEPMFAKLVLPLLGSAPAVWITCVLFFQAVLLAGYAYAHAGARLVGTRSQSIVLIGLLLLAMLTLPVRIPAGWVPPAARNPIPWLLTLLAVSLGLPFFLLSSMAPLLQRWFAATSHRAAGDPYFLYVASNLGSFLALLAYPTIMEATLTARQQADAWWIAYGVDIALVLACAVVVWRSSPPPPTAATAGTRSVGDGARERLGLTRRLRWLALSFVPASLMLGVTSYLTANIAPIPLLWVIPLAIYLLSFALVFGRRPSRTFGLSARLLPVLIVGLILTIALQAGGPPWFLIPLHLATFFAAAMVCHGQLAKDRPPVQHLTQFYLLLAVGGVFAGAFNALLAPAVFNTLVEYPLVLVLACLLIPRGGAPASRRPWIDVILPTALFAVVAGLSWAVSRTSVPDETLGRAIVFGAPAVACFSFSSRPLRFGLGMGAILLAGALPIGSRPHQLFADRNFYGIDRVVGVPGDHLLYSGTTIHGAQSQQPGRRDEPLTYYARTGPVGDLFGALAPVDARWHIGVIGLGTGSMACYGTSGQRWTFFELDPTVARIAQDPSLFSFLRDCVGGRSGIVLGDGRLSLQRAPDHSFGLIVVDAFNSDSIPVHLLTREAVALYRSKLIPGGVIAYHISNLYLDLHPVVAALAQDAGLVAYARDDFDVTPVQASAYSFQSEWVVLAQAGPDLGGLPEAPNWYRLLARPGDPVWTDQYSNVLRVFKWR
jgi:hypothetical protein